MATLRKIVGYTHARVGGGPWRRVPVYEDDQKRHEEAQAELAEIVESAYRRAFPERYVDKRACPDA